MPTMITKCWRAAPGGLLVPVLFVVLAGLLGMHGWGSHGVVSGQVASSHHMGISEAEHQAATVAHVGDALFAASPALTSSPDPAGMPMAGLCVAVLSGLGLVLLLLRARRPAYVPLPPRPRSPARRVSGRDRDPPSLARLSVFRR